MPVDRYEAPVEWSIVSAVPASDFLEPVYRAAYFSIAATHVVEVHKRKAGPRHRILQERDRRHPRQSMLAAQMQKSADKAAAAVSVIVTAARPMAVVGKMVEQLYRLCDFRFRHSFECSRYGNGRTVSRVAGNRSARVLTGD